MVPLHDTGDHHVVLWADPLGQVGRHARVDPGARLVCGATDLDLREAWIDHYGISRHGPCHGFGRTSTMSSRVFPMASVSTARKAVVLPVVISGADFTRSRMPILEEVSLLGLRWSSPGGRDAGSPRRSGRRPSPSLPSARPSGRPSRGSAARHGGGPGRPF